MDAARHIAESIPDGWLAAIGFAGAFDLEGSGGNAENEVAGKALREFLRIDHLEILSLRLSRLRRI
jgi:hypothetical protein